jgi:hypothetical protein
MSLDIKGDKDTQSIRDEVEQAVREGLGDRVDRGPWVVTLRRLPQKLGYVVDLSNLDGFMRQWVFTPGDPLAATIARELRAPVG